MVLLPIIVVILLESRVNFVSDSENDYEKSSSKSQLQIKNNLLEEKEPIELETDEVYDTYGINFDRSFGAIPSLEAIQYESHNGW